MSREYITSSVCWCLFNYTSLELCVLLQFDAKASFSLLLILLVTSDTELYQDEWQSRAWWVIISWWSPSCVTFLTHLSSSHCSIYINRRYWQGGRVSYKLISTKIGYPIHDIPEILRMDEDHSDSNLKLHQLKSRIPTHLNTFKILSSLKANE